VIFPQFLVFDVLLTKFFVFSKEHAYKTKPAVAMVANSCGLLILAFVLTVLLVIRNPNWGRQEMDGGYESVQD